MVNGRFHLRGLFAALLALTVQLSIGASVPRIDPLLGVGVLCHVEDARPGAPLKAPLHPADCLACPLCSALNTVAFAPVPIVDRPPPRAVVVLLKVELPPPGTAPPAAYRPPSQPRAPPIFS